MTNDSQSIPKNISEDYTLVVPFFDIDSMNIAWHGHYSKYLEVARCKLLDKIGYNYKDMAASGFMFPIVDMQIKFIKPLLFEQQVVITATIVECEFRLKIKYLIRDAATHKKLTTAYTIQAAVKTSNNSLQINCPDILIQKVLHFSK
jgi:acyl-CoA thioester hydrolase